MRHYECHLTHKGPGEHVCPAQSTKEELTRRKAFEDVIRRPYFHVKPLDAAQLSAWSHYIDYMDAKGDEKETRHLYERCLVACARYTGRTAVASSFEYRELSYWRLLWVEHRCTDLCLLMQATTCSSAQSNVLQVLGRCADALTAGLVCPRQPCKVISRDGMCCNDS